MGLNTPTCKVAIIGAGNMAREHIKAFSDIPCVEVVGICNRTRAKAQVLADEYNIKTVADTIDELYNKTQANLVVVTVYETAMLKTAVAALDHPWALLVEKPPGYSLDQISSLIAATEEKNRTVMVALNRRFLSSTKAVAQSLDVQAGPRHINVFDQQSLALARELKHETEVVNHWMYANSIHLVDYIRFLGRGQITEVNVTNAWNPDNFQVACAFVKFDSGDTATYQGIWEAPGPWAVSVTTPTIRWEMRPLEQATYQVPPSRTQHQIEMSEHDKNFKPGFREQAEQAARRAMGLESLSPTLYDAYESMKLINTIYGR